jgi:methylglutaconyl-CoA hydratase
MAGLTVSAPADGVLVAELDRLPGNLLTVELCEELGRQPDGAHVLRRAEAGIPRPAS